jgi:DNA-binding NarL/FixJ family response regulator
MIVELVDGREVRGPATEVSTGLRPRESISRASRRPPARRIASWRRRRGSRLHPLSLARESRSHPTHAGSTRRRHGQSVESADSSVAEGGLVEAKKPKGRVLKSDDDESARGVLPDSQRVKVPHERAEAELVLQAGKDSALTDLPSGKKRTGHARPPMGLVLVIGHDTRLAQLVLDRGWELRTAHEGESTACGMIEDVDGLIVAAELVERFGTGRAFALVRKLRRRSPKAPALIVVSKPGKVSVRRAYRLRVSYTCSPIDEKDVDVFLDCCAEAKLPTVGDLVVKVGRKLTEMQRAVFAASVESSVEKTIAEKVGKRLSTVRSHTAAIRVRLGVTSLEDAAAMIRKATLRR